MRPSKNSEAIESSVEGRTVEYHVTIRSARQTATIHSHEGGDSRLFQKQQGISSVGWLRREKSGGQTGHGQKQKWVPSGLLNLQHPLTEGA